VLVAQVGRRPQVVVQAQIEVPLGAGELEAPEGSVLPRIEEHGGLVTELHERVVELDPTGQTFVALSRRIPCDEIGEEIVLEGDEVAPRAVERIRRRRGLAGEAPPVAMEEASRAVGDAREVAEVDELGIAQQRCDGPVLHQEALEAVPRAKLAVARDPFAGDADTRQSPAQRDEPDPVALVHEVDRRESARRMPDARAELLRPHRVDVRDVLEAPPHGPEAVILLRNAQIELSRERSHAPRGVDDPTRGVLAPSGLVLDAEAVGSPAGAELERANGRTAAHVDAVSAVHVQEVPLEARAIELEGGMEGQAHAAHLAHPLEGEVALRGIEEVAQAVLRELALVEIGREAEPAHQVVGCDLHGRLPHLRGVLRGPLEEPQPELGKGDAELPGQQVPGEPPSDDRDVDLLHPARPPSRPLTACLRSRPGRDR